MDELQEAQPFFISKADGSRTKTQPPPYPINPTRNLKFFPADWNPHDLEEQTDHGACQRHEAKGLAENEIVDKEKAHVCKEN